MSEEVEIILTAKQEKFCYEYCLDFNATQAAIRAGYSKKTARVIATQNLSKLYIRNKINELQKNLAETAGISRLKVLREHEKIAFSSIANIHDDWMMRKDFELLSEEVKSCIAEIDTKVRVEYEYDPDSKDRKPVTVEYVKLKLYDKQKALDSICRMLGFEAPTKMEVGLTNSQMPDIILKPRNVSS